MIYVGILNPIDALQKKDFHIPMIPRILHMLIGFHDIMFFDAPFRFSHTHTQKLFPRTFPFGESRVKHQNALTQWLQWGP